MSRINVDGLRLGARLRARYSAFMSRIVLHGDPQFVSPYAFSVFVALREKDLPFEYRAVDLKAGEHLRSPYADRSLTARIPALEHEGFWLSESSAIDEYLDEVFAPPTHPRLMPADPQRRARARQVMAFVRSDIASLREERSSESVFHPDCRVTKTLSPAANRDAAKLVRLAVGLIDASGTSAFGGFCIADIDLAMALMRLVRNGDPVPTAVRTYAERQFDRPSARAFIEQPRGPYYDYYR